MAIELWLHYPDRIEEMDTIKNAPCVPRQDEVMDTGRGMFVVDVVKYDFHPTDGEVRVHVRLREFGCGQQRQTWG